MSNTDFLYTANPGLVIGFHGCDKSICDTVVSGNAMLKASANTHDWLGSGFYFWQNNYERALDFATNPPNRSKKIKVPSVLGAILDLNNCLDLTDKRWIDLVKDSYKSFRESTILFGKQMPVNCNPLGDPFSVDKVIRELDCAVIENIHKITGNTEPFDSIRGIFIEGKALYHDAGFYEKTNIQICIRNPNCIKGFFHPRQRVDWP
nr:hypothetical protein [uncultured Chitinophaga sp.]